MKTTVAKDVSGNWADSMFDWVDPNSRRSPQAHPYSFSEYYILRPRLTNGKRYSVYHDRMRSWDGESFKRAVDKSGIRFMDTMPDIKVCREFINEYYNGRSTLVGLTVSCNQSSGYPIYCFIIQDVEEKAVDTKA